MSTIQLTLEIITYSFALWLGLYLIGRNPAAPRLWYARVGNHSLRPEPGYRCVSHPRFHPRSGASLQPAALALALSPSLLLVCDDAAFAARR